MSAYVNQTGEGYLGVLSIYGKNSSAGISVSKNYLQQLGIGEGEKVAVFVEDDRVVLQHPRYGTDGAKAIRTTNKPGGSHRRRSGALSLTDHVDHLAEIDTNIRIYERHWPHRLVLVPRDTDPLLTEPDAPTDLDPAEADEVGVNEVRDALADARESDVLELRVSFMTEAAGEQRESFRMVVSSTQETDDDAPFRIELDYPWTSGLWAPPQPGEWYITGGTAHREGSNVPYGIDSLRIWRWSS